MKQVMMNLCLNARDAMPEGGTLTVRTEKLEQGNETWVRFVVEDTGTGMDLATLAHIFEPFFSTKERGTGLGLAVVQQIVQSCGGRIDAHSQPGQGTRMEIYLKPV